MVFEVSGHQQLSQTNVRTMSQKCVDLISRAACVEQIRKDVVEPVLKYYAEANPPKTLANDSVFLAWRLLRQGTMLCLLLNNLRTGILEKFNPLETTLSEAAFTDTKSRENIKIFLAACKGDLYMTDDQLFSETALYTDDTNTLRKAIQLTDSFFTKIGRIQSANFAEKVAELQATNPLFSLAADDAIVPDGVGGDLRLRVIKETLETEQQYIADLDKLQSYAEELRMDKIITPEAYVAIFSNLDKLVDFQRRFLMQMEAKITRTVLKDVKASYKAGIAQLFIDNEEGFTSVYETFCPNHQRAAEMVAIEMANLRKKERVMDPKVVLQAFLIKPTQRICKYPLLLRELIRLSAPDAPDRKDLERAEEFVNRITSRVNEKSRHADMVLFADEIKSLVKDWKGLDPETFGDLLLKDLATIMIGENTKDLDVYLYENVLIMCGKSKSMGDFLIGSRRTTRNQLVIKGHIFINQIIGIARVASSTEGQHAFKMTYRNVNIEYCTLRFTLEEKVKTWTRMMQKLADSSKSQNKVVTTKERRRRSLIAACPMPIAPPVPITATNTKGIVNGKVLANIGGATPKPVIKGDEEPLRLKIICESDIFVTPVFTDITSLSDLRNAVIKKLRASYKMLEKPFLLSADGLIIKYIDEAKDAILLLDDSDVDAALIFSPASLTVRVETGLSGRRTSSQSAASAK